MNINTVGKEYSKMRYAVTVQTTDVNASKRHAGQLHLECKELTPQEWPELELTGPAQQLERFLAKHCGSVRAGQEYFNDFAQPVA